jgi:hypothetical protein
MKKALSIIAGLAIGASAFTLQLHKGWNLKGSSEKIDVSVFNNPNIKSVWAYDDVNHKWKVYMPGLPASFDFNKHGVEKLTQINPYDGFWVNALNDVTVNIDNITNNNSTPPSIESNDKKNNNDKELAITFDNVKKVLYSMKGSRVTFQFNSNYADSETSANIIDVYKHCILKDIEISNSIGILANLYGCTVETKANDEIIDTKKYDDNTFVISVGFLYDPTYGVVLAGPQTPVKKLTNSLIKWSEPISGGNIEGFIEKE